MTFKAPPGTPGTARGTRRRRLHAVVAIMSASALLLAACANGETDEDDAAADDAAADDDDAEPAESDRSTVTVGIPEDISGLDAGAYTASHDTRLLLNVYDSLTNRDAEGDLIPGLAHDWEVSDDYLTWTFFLEEGVLFHNGEEMTADDVAFNINRYADPDFPGGVAAQYENVGEATVVDDYTVEVEMEQPNPRFARDLGMFRSPIVPRSEAEGLDYDEYASSEEGAIGTGAFRVADWSPDERLVLEAFEDHWRGAPAFDELHFVPIPDDAARTSALLAGDIDVAQTFPIEQVDALDGSHAEVERVFGTRRIRILLNNQEGPFSDIRVRQAVNHAIDKEAITEHVMEGLAEPVHSTCLPNEVGYDPDLGDTYPHDPDRARELLEEAGYPDGFEVDFPIRSGTLKSDEVGDAIAAMLTEVGITANVQVMGSADWASGSENKEYDMSYSRNGGGGLFACDSAMRTLFHRERGNPVHTHFYINEELEQLLDDAAAITDEEGAVEMVQEASRMIVEDAGEVPLYHEPTLWGVHEDLDWTPHGTDALFFQDAAWS